MSYRLISLAFGLSLLPCQINSSNAQDFSHCSWNGKPAACRTSKTANGFRIYWSEGGVQEIVKDKGDKVWIINDGVREPGVMKGRRIKRLTDGVEFTY